MPESHKKTHQASKEGPRQPLPGAPLIFISHDSRDFELAEAFSKLLSSISAGVLKSFRSSDRKGSQGIEYGVEWYPELMKKLASASDIVCLLTSRSLDRPWMLYEAGVAKGKLDTPVYGIALGIPLNKANSGPFAQFQNCDDKVESLTKLVVQLLARVPGSEPDHEAVQMQVKLFRDRLDALLKHDDSPKETELVDSPGDSPSIAKLFEEIKVMFQDMPSRVEARLLEGSFPIKSRRRRRLHPMMFEEFFHVSPKGGDPIALLLIAGTIRDELPWLHELLVTLYREIKEGNAEAAKETQRNIRRASEVMMHGPWIEEMGIHPGEFERIAMELPMLLDRYVTRLVDRPVKQISKVKPGADSSG